MRHVKNGDSQIMLRRLLSVCYNSQNSKMCRVRLQLEKDSKTERRQMDTICLHLMPPLWWREIIRSSASVVSAGSYLAACVGLVLSLQ